MIDALIGGKLVGAAVERSTASSGKTFVSCKIRAADSEGESQFVNVVAFDDGVKAAMLALGDGDSVSVSGPMKIDSYEARDGTTRVSIKLVASAVLTPYHTRRRRDAIAQASSKTPSLSPVAGASKRCGQREAAAVGDAMPDDDVAF